MQAGAHRLVVRALEDDRLAARVRSTPLHIVAAGKAAPSMIDALVGAPGVKSAEAVAIGSHLRGQLPQDVEWIESSHPIPDERSVAAAARVLAVARRVPPDEQLILLLSGGASALVAAPHEGLTLEDKQRAVRAIMLGGADIVALNAVRKHISAVKGGRVAQACRGRTLTLAVSDVVGDDVSVIGSGPGVPDPSTWAEAWKFVQRYAASADLPAAVVELFHRGLRGEVADTPKAQDASMARSEARVIGGRQDAIDGARDAARARGYHVAIIAAPVVGEARTAARGWLDRVRSLVEGLPRPACVLSAGETTVRVTGGGRGGRNQEFSLALVRPLAGWAGAAAASVGTDGIDGPTPAAGAVADWTSLARALAERTGEPEGFLDANDSFTFFEALGDLVQTGRTDTNVGDLQAFLLR